MARQTDDAHVVCIVLAAELCAEADVVSLFEHLLFQLDVAEGTAVFITRRGQVIIEAGGGELHGQQVLLGRRTANDEGNMVRRTSRRTQRLHLLYEERNQRLGVQDGFRLLIEVSLVGRTAALGHAKELVFHAFGSLDINLCGQVALGVHLLVHGERSVLRVAQVLLGISLIYTQRQGLFVAIARPYLLAFLTVDDGRTGILAEGKQTLGGHFGIAQEGQCHVLVVVAGFGVAQNLGHLLVVRAAQHERHVAEGRVGHGGQSFLLNLQDGFSFKLAYRHVVLGKQIILSRILALLEHGLILERRCCCHNYNLFKRLFNLD